MTWFDYTFCFLTLIAFIAGAIQISYSMGLKEGTRREAAKRAQGCKCMRKKTDRNSDRRH